MAKSEVVLRLALRPNPRKEDHEPSATAADDQRRGWLRRRAEVLVPHYRGELRSQNGVIAGSFGSLGQIHARRAARAGWALRFAALETGIHFTILIASDEAFDVNPVDGRSLGVASAVAQRLRPAVALMSGYDGRLKPNPAFLTIDHFVDSVEQQLAELRGVYDINIDARLQPMLRKPLDWHGVLVRTHRALRQEFGWTVQLVLDAEPDYERGSSNLVLRIVVSGGDPGDWAARFENFTRNWWSDVDRSMRDRLQLDLRLTKT